MLSLFVNSAPVLVEPRTSVAAAIMIAGCDAFRTSPSGQPRGPLCGIGICFECRVTIDGQAHVKSCQIICEAGMQVETT